MADDTDDTGLSDLTAELSGKQKIRSQCRKLYKNVQKGFDDQNQRANESMDWWDCYNGVLNTYQGYDGNSQAYVPLVHNAIEARVTRFVNQIFPSNGRYVEIVTNNSDDLPSAHAALIEDYIRNAKLRTEVMPALVRNGDVEGQYSIYVTWKETKRTVRWREMEGVQVDGIEGTSVDGADKIENVKEEEITDGGVHVEVIADSDLCVLPSTTQSIEKALNDGGSVTVLFRLSESQVQAYIDDGTFTQEAGDRLKKGFISGQKQRDAAKHNAKAAGIKVHEGSMYAQVYQTWSVLKVGKEKRLCVTWFGGPDNILSCKLNPYWCDRCPVISVPVKKTGGVFKGMSQVKPIAPMQYAANDACNEGLDSATFSLLPIVMTDPEKNPQIGSMVMNLAAIWQTNPNDTQIVEFPQLWKEAFEIINQCTTQVFQALGVNPSMITQGTYRKQTQAEVAQEQQVDIMTTADAVTTLEEGILTPLVERIYDYDRQFRTEEITIKAYGEMGERAIMETIDPIQDNRRYFFRWFGVEQARSAQRVQQQISFLNVLRGIPEQFYRGREIDLVPVLENACENVFGPRLAPLTFKDLRDKLSVDPAIENNMLNNRFEVHVHEMDDDAMHIQSHMADLQAYGDPSGFIRVHLLAHQNQLMMKQQAAMQQGGQAPGSPGVPGAPGVPGTPRPGSVPKPPQGAKQPPGVIHPDKMGAVDPGAMPRKM